MQLDVAINAYGLTANMRRCGIGRGGPVPLSDAVSMRLALQLNEGGRSANVRRANGAAPPSLLWLGTLSIGVKHYGVYSSISKGHIQCPTLRSPLRENS